MIFSVVFDPLVPWVLWGVLAAICAAVCFFALWRGLRSSWIRLPAFGVMLAALANPALQREQRAPLGDIVLAVVDQSASQSLGPRQGQTDRALAHLRAKLAAFPDVELRTAFVGDGADNTGTMLFAAMNEALEQIPADRLAGVVVISDGIAHDFKAYKPLGAPLNLLQSGRQKDWDRRLIVKNAPAFAIIGEPLTLTVRIEDQGNVPKGRIMMTQLSIRVDGGEPQLYDVAVGEDIELGVTLPHGGQNILQFEIAPVEGELTPRNNSSITVINGVRDRLRVLLVSGEPHAGERVWRNLLKSDPAVDLVHFTILRPQEKAGLIPNEELSLIAFPVDELFIEKIKEFDLIIFDRYRLRDTIPPEYLENVREYILGGGTVLVAAGPEFGAYDGLLNSPLANILPVESDGEVITQGFLPEITSMGQRHPVTRGLNDVWKNGKWGRWFRQVALAPLGQGQVLMSGANDLPLLVLSREGEGRVAVLASDQAWLWGRGYEGGGPQLELLRRLAHWMLKEPDLEEEALTARPIAGGISLTRRTIGTEPLPPVSMIKPDGSTALVPLKPDGDGTAQAEILTGQQGLYIFRQDKLETVLAIGPAAPREYEDVIAKRDILAPMLQATKGGVLRLEDVPDFGLRKVALGSKAAGAGWIGFAPRGAYTTQDVRLIALLPPWGYLAVIGALILFAWLREGRRIR